MRQEHITKTELTGSKAQTVQTHNAVSVGASGNSVSAWNACEGFDEIGVSFMNDAYTSSQCVVLWSFDGTNIQGREEILPTHSLKWLSKGTKVKAKYFQVEVKNNDDTAAHTMSAWAYLKV